MFGTLRLFLACTVVIYHGGYHPYGLLTGVSAVTVFYMISGYVISGLYTTKFTKVKNARYFYIDRLIRIAPQYYFYLLITIIIFHIPWGIEGIPDSKITVLNLASNITLLPLGLRIYLPSSLNPMATIFPLVGTTWSLANEFIFYLIAPLVLVVPVFTFSALFTSLCVFCLASHGILSIYQFSYWVLPGPLVFFLIGHFIYQRKWAYLTLTIIILFLNHLHLIYSGLISRYSGLEATGFNLDIYIGLYFGLIIILFLRSLKPNVIDNWLGSISYGCFLCHFPIYALFIVASKRGLIHLGDNQLMYPIIVLLLSCGLGVFSYHFIEKPLRKYRFQRRFNKMDNIDKTVMPYLPS